MKLRPITILVANLFAASGAFAQDTGDGFRISGTVEAGVLGTSVSATDKAKAKEYRDLNDGLVGGFDLKGRSTYYWTDAFGENLGRKDMYIDVKGGRYDSFKYQLYTDNMTHNWALGARSPLNGLGGSTLLGPYPTNAPASSISSLGSWNTFDARDKIRNSGAMFEYSGGTPWYIRGEYNEKTDRGIKLMSGAQGTSPGNGFVDLAAPLDYRTRNFSAEGGYSSKTAHVAANLLHSRFSNNVDTFRWQNNFFGGGPALLDTTTLAADSTQTKFGMNGNLRKLPWDSTLAGRITYSRTTNSIPILNSMLSTNGTTTALYPTNGSIGQFNGNVVHKTASVSWQFNPTRSLDFRPYLNWYRKDNGSPIVQFTGLGTSGLACGRTTTVGGGVVNPGDCTTETISYRKNNVGFDIGYRINGENRVTGNLDYQKLTRNRFDINETKDMRYQVEWRNTSVEDLQVRAKYQYLDRDANFLLAGTGTSLNDPQALERFVRRYDATDLKQNLYKIGADYTPIPKLDFGLEGVFKDNKYGQTVLGRTKDERREIFLSTAYGDINEFRVMGFVDYETVRYDSFHRNISSVISTPGAAPNNGVSGNCQTTFGNCFDPSIADNTSNYNWKAVSKDRNTSFGLGADWKPTSRLKVNSSLSWTKTTGRVDFAVPGLAGGAPVTGTVPILSSDDTRKVSFNIRATYQATKQWDVTGGYAYERYTFKDIAYEGYQNMVPGAIAGGVPNYNSTSSSWLSGANANPNYRINAVYVKGTYKFD